MALDSCPIPGLLKVWAARARPHWSGPSGPPSPSQKPSRRPPGCALQWESLAACSGSLCLSPGGFQRRVHCLVLPGLRRCLVLDLLVMPQQLFSFFLGCALPWLPWFALYKDPLSLSSPLSMAPAAEAVAVSLLLEGPAGTSEMKGHTFFHRLSITGSAASAAASFSAS